MTAIILGLLLTAFVLPMGEKISYPAISKAGIGFSSIDNEKYRYMIEDINEEINSAFIDWDLDEIRKYYTENAILDQESRPTIIGINNIMNDYAQQKSSGLVFKELKYFISDLWKEGKNIHVLENFIYKIRFSSENISLAGSGRSYSIWEQQDDDSLKIKYSIFNLENIKPRN